jgi:hypothetical protein
MAERTGIRPPTHTCVPRAGGGATSPPGLVELRRAHRVLMSQGHGPKEGHCKLRTSRWPGLAQLAICKTPPGTTSSMGTSQEPARYARRRSKHLRWRGQKQESLAVPPQKALCPNEGVPVARERLEDTRGGCCYSLAALPHFESTRQSRASRQAPRNMRSGEGPT